MVPNRPLPREPDSAVIQAPPPNLVWQHTMHAGTFAVDKVHNVLLEAFRVPQSEQNFGGRIGSDSAVLCFPVNEGGDLIRDSVHGVLMRLGG